MAELFGRDGIHCVTGNCDLCGVQCDAGAEELNCLSCTFGQCESGIYHQDCLEKFLKRIGCEKCVLFSMLSLSAEALAASKPTTNIDSMQCVAVSHAFAMAHLHQRSRAMV
jgi:hypothetical protein